MYQISSQYKLINKIMSDSESISKSFQIHIQSLSYNNKQLKLINMKRLFISAIIISASVMGMKAQESALSSLSSTIREMPVSYALRDEDKPVDETELPQMAIEFLKKNFADTKIAMAKYDWELFGGNYDVILVDGTKIEFDKEGKWYEIDCKFGEVPASIVPEKIASYVKDRYPDAKTTKIDRKKNKYEIKLSNGIELKFNKDFKLTGFDD